MFHTAAQLEILLGFARAFDVHAVEVPHGIRREATVLLLLRVRAPELRLEIDRSAVGQL